MDRMLSVGSWIALAAGLALAGTAATMPTGAPPRTRTSAPVARATVALPRSDADSLATIVVAADPFRSERRPASVPYDPTRVGQVDGDETPRPRLRLLGLVMGGGARALIEGLPGVNGARLLAPGDSAGGLRIAAISVRGARVVGMDTTWTLTLERRP